MLSAFINAINYLTCRCRTTVPHKSNRQKREYLYDCSFVMHWRSSFSLATWWHMGFSNLQTYSPVTQWQRRSHWWAPSALRTCLGPTDIRANPCSAQINSGIADNSSASQRFQRVNLISFRNGTILAQTPCTLPSIYWSLKLAHVACHLVPWKGSKHVYQRRQFTGAQRLHVHGSQQLPAPASGGARE